MVQNSQTKKQTATIFLLKALIPYTQENLRLSFHPGQFFDELEQASDFSRHTLQQSFSRLKKQQYISNDGMPELTTKGRRYVQPFVARKLDNDAQLMVIFDIPEDYGEHRRQLRNLLRHLGFSQVQRSVWMSPNDHVGIIREAVAEYNISDWVELYEASRIR